MNMAGIQSATVGMAFFDMWMAGVKKAHKANRTCGSPLVAAVADAFEAYLNTQEVGHAAQIAGAAVYALNPGRGSAKAVTSQQIAPFLALNIMG